MLGHARGFALQATEKFSVIVHAAEGPKQAQKPKQSQKLKQAQKPKQAADNTAFRICRVHSPHGSGACPSLLTKLCYNPAEYDYVCAAERLVAKDVHEDGSTVVLYLHGFPDWSVDPVSHDFGSRFSRKLSQSVLEALPRAVFVCFNSSGIPGSDDGLSFEDKSVSEEVKDALNIVSFIQQELFLHPASPPSVHVVGLSTGAIISALLRKPLQAGHFGKCTVTAIAGLADEREGIKLDFDETQLADFELQGWCWKEFWLRTDMPLQPCEKEQEGGSEGETQVTTARTTRKTQLRLKRAYLDEFLQGQLDVRASVGASSGGGGGAHSVPMLVVHGDKDRSVPLQCGQALYEAAAEPKRWLLIKGGNHLLSNSTHFKKAAAAVIEFARQNS